MPTIVREVVLLLGSNMGDRERHLRNGVAALSPLVDVSSVSKIYESEPFGRASQPWFLNVAIMGTTSARPRDLLRHVKRIEKDEGRTDDGERWGPRPLDIDIILVGDLVVSDPDLTVPHASMALRRFCLLPVSEIAPGFPVPPDGTTVLELLERCTDSLEVYPL